MAAETQWARLMPRPTTLKDGFALRKLRPHMDRQLPRDEVEAGRHRSVGAPRTDKPSTWSAPAALLKGGAAAQPPGDVPGLTTNKMNSVKTSPST